MSALVLASQHQARQLGDLLERLFADAGKGSSLNFGDFALTYSRNGAPASKRR